MIHSRWGLGRAFRRSISDEGDVVQVSLQVVRRNSCDGVTHGMTRMLHRVKRISKSFMINWQKDVTNV